MIKQNYDITAMTQKAKGTIVTVVLLTALFVVASYAEAETVIIDGPSSIPEGGLVAQVEHDCGGPPYCEYRDLNDNVNVKQGRMESFSVRVENAQGGSYYRIIGSIGLEFHNPSMGELKTIRYIQYITIPRGATQEITFEVAGIANFTPQDTNEANISVTFQGNEIARHDVTVEDDDQSAYIGSLNQHPYEGQWRSSPSCYTIGCAWD